MAELQIKDLHARTSEAEILKGVDVTVRSGEVHAIMGPNGSGKSTLSHVLMGRPGYSITQGEITLDGKDLTGLQTWERAQLGLFLALQYPVEIEGVPVTSIFETSELASKEGYRETLQDAKNEAELLGVPSDHLSRGVNLDMSGGEKKRLETLQLVTLKPSIAVLDELDSGLDVDGLRIVSNRVERLTKENGLGVLVITHYSRLLEELKPDHVHVFVEGKIVASGDSQLAEELESDGYEKWTPSTETSVTLGGLI
ncbi:MAG: Fe-S cluster assembly ATPase SufC [Acidimicrobiaceae bacterium]|nr:Fe-S cluster assembly ATPase SufC [Acidimicrobiaceae bacterium]